MDPQSLQQCQDVIGYQFGNPSLLVQALTHASVAPTRLDSNERMEFLGDAVLGLVVCDELFTSQRELLEGEMTKIKSSVVSRQTCAIIAQQLDLVPLLSMGKGMERPGGLPQSIAAAVLEAIIGAIYLDGGLDAARTFVLEHVRPFIQKVLDDQHARNYKSILQQYSQSHWSRSPEYHLLDEKGPDHSKCFEIAVTVNGRHFPSAWGMNKKEAEQEAARRALVELGILT